MDFNNVLILTPSKQDQNYIAAITKLDNASFDYSVYTVPGCELSKFKNEEFPLFCGKKEEIDKVRRILGLC